MSEKTITYTEGLKNLCSTAESKMLENDYKEDPVTEPYGLRSTSVFREYEEFDEALDDFMADPSPENYFAMEKEGGDVINEILFTCLKAQGVTKMERK